MVLDPFSKLILLHGTSGHGQDYVFLLINRTGYLKAV